MVYRVSRLNIEESLHQKIIQRRAGVEAEPVVVNDDFHTLSELLLDKCFASVEAIGEVIAEGTVYFGLGKKVESRDKFEEWTLVGSSAAHGDPLRLKKDQKLAGMLLQKIDQEYAM